MKRSKSKEGKGALGCWGVPSGKQELARQLASGVCGPGDHSTPPPPSSSTFPGRPLAGQGDRGPERGGLQKPSPPPPPTGYSRKLHSDPASHLARQPPAAPRRRRVPGRSRAGLRGGVVGWAVGPERGAGRGLSWGGALGEAVGGGIWTGGGALARWAVPKRGSTWGRG